MLRPLVLSAMLLLSLAGCLGGPQAQGDGMRAVPRQLSDSDQVSSRLGDCQVLGVVELRAPGDQRFGGWSGMSLQGDQMTMVSDVGQWARFRLLTGADGRPVGAEDLRQGPLGGIDGGKDDGDAEELAQVPDGWVVSFERRHRLLHYGDDLSVSPGRLDTPPEMSLLPVNGGIEALTRLPSGRLLMFAEDTPQVWLGTEGQWGELSYPHLGGFHPTSAAALPDGAVLVLERSYSLIAGVEIRLVRIEAAAIRPGAELHGRELFRLRPPLLVDNYEALALRRRGDGRMVAYLVSDDNFNPLQATLLMAVLLPDN